MMETRSQTDANRLVFAAFHRPRWVCSSIRRQKTFLAAAAFSGATGKKSLISQIQTLSLKLRTELVTLPRLNSSAEANKVLTMCNYSVYFCPHDVDVQDS